MDQIPCKNCGAWGYHCHKYSPGAPECCEKCDHSPTASWVMFNQTRILELAGVEMTDVVSDWSENEGSLFSKEFE